MSDSWMQLPEGICRMTRYTQGTGLEYDIMFMLKRSGYYVMRSAGSHGIVDLIAWWKNQIYFIQCKKKQAGYEKGKQTELVRLCEKLLPNPIPLFGYRQKIPKSPAVVIIQNLITKESIFCWPRKGIRSLQQEKNK